MASADFIEYRRNVASATESTSSGSQLYPPKAEVSLEALGDVAVVTAAKVGIAPCNQNPCYLRSKSSTTERSPAASSQPRSRMPFRTPQPGSGS